MSAVLSTEKFVAIESAVKASTAPVEISAAFTELAKMREQLKKKGELICNPIVGPIVGRWNNRLWRGSDSASDV